MTNSAKQRRRNAFRRVRGRGRSLVLLLAVTTSGACVSVSKSVLSEARLGQPVPLQGVYVYLPGDEVPEHERIAILSAEGDEDFTNEGQMIDKLREEAGKLGANAIILGELEDPGTGERVVSAIFGTTAERKGQAIAIYVPSLRAGPP